MTLCRAALGLSDKGKTILLSVNRNNEPGKKYREVFIDLGGQVMKVYRNELSPEEYYTYTTEEREKLKVLQYAEKYGEYGNWNQKISSRYERKTIIKCNHSKKSCMRYLQTMALICLIILTGCTSEWNQEAAIKRFIPGTYVKEVKNEFLFASDTLIIQCTAGDNYPIVNRTVYQRIKGNRLSPQQYSEVNLKAIYNDESGNLYEQRLGKTFSFDPANRRLFEGGSEYKKVVP